MKGSIALMVAGRRAGRAVVIVDVVDAMYVKVDDGVKQRRMNLAHLRFTGRSAGTADVRSALKDAGYPVAEKKPHAKKEASVSAESPSKKKPSKKKA